MATHVSDPIGKPTARHRRRRPPRAGEAPPVDALHADGRVRRPRGAGDRARRGVLRVRRARQALSRRALGAVLREHRPRPRRARGGRRRAGAGARRSTPTGATPTRARSSWPRGSPRSPPGTSTACSSPPAARRRSSRRGSSPRPTTPPAASRRRHKLVSRQLAYHGTSMGALTATGAAARCARPSSRSRRAAHHVPNTNSYRWTEDRDPLWAADAIEEAILFEGPRRSRR